MPALSPDPATTAMAATTAPRTLTVELPLPPIECSPNSRVPPRAKAPAIKAYRIDCAAAFRKAAKEAGIHFFENPIKIDLEFHMTRPSQKNNPLDWFKNQHQQRYFPLDSDNARGAAKPLQDSLQTGDPLTCAGLIWRDNDETVKTGEVKLIRDSGRTCVICTITELGESA